MAARERGARGGWREAFLHRRTDEAPQRRTERTERRTAAEVLESNAKAMLEQDRQLLEQLAARPAERSREVRKKPPTPPKVSPYKFRLDTAPPSPSESDQVPEAPLLPVEEVSEEAVAGPEVRPQAPEAATDLAQPAEPEPAEPEQQGESEPVRPSGVTVVPKSGELFSADDIEHIMSSITGDEATCPSSGVAPPEMASRRTDSLRARRRAEPAEDFSLPDRSKLREQIRAIDSWLEDDVMHEQVNEGHRLRKDESYLQEVLAKSAKVSKQASDVTSEAEVFGKLESARSRHKAGEKLPQNELKELSQRVKPLLPTMNLEQLVRALKLFSATGYQDHALYLSILGEIPVQVRGISAEMLTKCLRLLWKLRLNEETYLELFSMEAMNMIRAQRTNRCKVRRHPKEQLEVKAAPKPALAPFSARMLVQIGNSLAQLGAKHPSRFMDVYQEQIAIAIPNFTQEECELVTPCLAASPLLPDALRRAFLERCAEVDAGAPLMAPEATAAPDIAQYQQDTEVYRRRAKSFKNIFVIEASVRKETWAFFSSLPTEVRSYLDRLHERGAAMTHAAPVGFAAEVAQVLDQLGVNTWTAMAGPLELHLLQAKNIHGEQVVYECNEADAYCALRQEERTPQLTMATKFRHKLLQRMGVQLVHINVWEWNHLSEAQRINYMVKLQSLQA